MRVTAVGLGRGAVALALVLGGCADAREERGAPAPTAAPSTVAEGATAPDDPAVPEGPAVPPATSAPPATAPAPTTATTAPPAPPKAASLAKGAKGPEVEALERRLADLKYDVGAVDGAYDATTTQAVMAFQKVHGLARDGKAGPAVRAALATATAPAPLVPAGGATRVEVDVPRQVLLLYKGGALARIVAVSTGSGRRYCVDDECARAVTPGGAYRISRRIDGWRTSRLGELYNPLYFNGGIAIHGAPSVPATPASHGCVRIPMSAAEWLPSSVANGTPVYVVGGPRAPVPFDGPAPAGTTPTTKAPATKVPATKAPTMTKVPATKAPTTAAPPTTKAPPTTVPTTAVPTTGSTSATPPATTPAPVATAPPTTGATTNPAPAGSTTPP